MQAAKVKKATNPQPEPTPAPPSICPARIELVGDGKLKIRTFDGALRDATSSPDLDPRLIDECLRQRRVVLVSVGPQECLVIGALQTQASAAVRTDHELSLRSERIELEADRAIRLTAGRCTLELRHDGVVRVSGDALTFDLARLMKVLAAKVELP